MNNHPPIASHLLPEWLAAGCELGRNHFDTAGRLYDSWRAFARERSSEPGSPSEFAEQMERRGFTIDQLRGERRRIRWGLRLRPAMEATP